MGRSAAELYLGTVLFEPNRWTPAKEPTVRVSRYLDRARAAGFDGLELWENHAALAPADELALLRAADPPVVVFNTYCTFDDASAARAERAAALVRSLGARAVKWNFGRDPARAAEEVRGVRRFAAMLPPGVRLLCECHPGTFAERPADAARLLDDVGPPAQFQAIVHSARDRATHAAWLDALGPRVTHSHVVLYRQPRCPADAEPDALDGLRDLTSLGFAGTYTLEFTRGVNTPADRPEQMLASAVHDARLVREVIG